MSEVKIHTVNSEDLSPRIVGEGFCTDVVRYSDYAAMEARCAALAAENAALKESAKEALAHWAAAEPGEMEQMMDKCMPSLRVSYSETPATDAFIAEQRAIGVEQLANAWYAIANETDPGVSISDSLRLNYRQRADDAAHFANEIRQEAGQ